MNIRLYEREAAVEAIRQLLDAAIDGHGGSDFVVAAAGLGKTSVLQTAATAASGRFDVRAGGGDAVETTLPYGPIGQVLGDEEEPDALASSAEQETCLLLTGSTPRCAGSGGRPPRGRYCWPSMTCTGLTRRAYLHQRALRALLAAPLGAAGG